MTLSRFRPMDSIMRLRSWPDFPTNSNLVSSSIGRFADEHDVGGWITPSAKQRFFAVNFQIAAIECSKLATVRPAFETLRRRFIPSPIIRHIRGRSATGQNSGILIGESEHKCRKGKGCCQGRSKRAWRLVSEAQVGIVAARQTDLSALACRRPLYIEA